MMKYVSDPVRVLGAAVALGGLLITACDSSSSSAPSARQAQAIDGYLVGSTVLCDDASETTTGAAGRFSCPAGTLLFRVRGGKDVGFDEAETEEGTAFLGELSGPSNLDFVTPLSTILVALASVNGDYLASNFDAAVETLRAALGSDTLDLNANAATSMPNVRLNSQINEIIKEFSSTVGEYSIVMSAFARTLDAAAASGTSVSLTAGVGEALEALNNELISNIDNINLSKQAGELEEAKGRIEGINSQIERATEPGSIGLVTGGGNRQPPPNAALTINRNLIDISFDSDDGDVRPFSIEDFESNTLSDDTYTVSVDRQLAAIGVDRDGLVIDRSLEDAGIELGFRLEARGADDRRQLSVTTDDAVLSMTSGDASSISVSVPDGSQMNVTAVERDGTSTNATFVVDGDETFSSDEDFVRINLDSIERRLDDKEITGFLDQPGNYRVTMLVGGVSVRQTQDGVDASLNTYTITAGNQTVNGEGFQGYASFR